MAQPPFLLSSCAKQNSNSTTAHSSSPARSSSSCSFFPLRAAARSSSSCSFSPLRLHSSSSSSSFCLRPHAAAAAPPPPSLRAAAGLAPVRPCLPASPCRAPAGQPRRRRLLLAGPRRRPATRAPWALIPCGRKLTSPLLWRLVLGEVKRVPFLLCSRDPSRSLNGLGPQMGHKRSNSIKSAPHFEIESPGSSQNCTLDITLGTSRWIEVIETHLPRGLSHASAMVRTASLTCFAGMTSDVFFSLPVNKRDYVTSSSVHAASSDAVATVRSAACRAIGIVSCFSQILSSPSLPGEFVEAIEFNTRNSSTPVRITASWALANLCSSIRFRALELQADPAAGVLDKSTISLLVEIALRLTKDGEKVKSNAVRALGYLSRFIRFNHHSDAVDEPSNSVFYGDPVWLERMVQALMSCVTTGNVKVQWNVCHALSNLFMNDTLRLSDMPWASSVYSILLLLLRDSNNYKIRMHAAVALAVPVTRLDYGSSFPDVVQGLEHVLESFCSNNSSSPSNFKHRDNLEKQLTFTALHLFGFVSPKDDQSLKDFLIKKASFLEDWLKSLCSLFNSAEDQPLASETINDEDGFSPNVSQKVMLSSAVQSLLNVYTSGNQQTIAQRFEQLARSIA